jgi:hypothetical protein
LKGVVTCSYVDAYVKLKRARRQRARRERL